MRVRDIMQREVVTVGPEDSVRDLVKLLISRGITGVPVVEEDGRTVGVVSATDVLRFAATESEIPVGDVALNGDLEGEGGTGEDADEALLDYFLDPDSGVYRDAPDLSSLAESAFDQVRVRDIMTPAIFRVRGEATVTELARFLVVAGVHRALVMEHGLLAGVVSAIDVVRAVAESSDTSPPFTRAASR